MPEPADDDVYDAVVVGGGPAGLSAALNLGRARARILVVDADRPRNAATLNSHGFLTRDGTPPHELRRLARTELGAYPLVEVLVRTRVTAVTTASGPRAAAIGGISARQTDRSGQPATTAGDARFVVALEGRRSQASVRARSVIVATGLRETLPGIPSIRAFYGMSVFSCAACDAWELQDRRLGLIGETSDLADRARLIARWTDRLTVFTNGADVVDAVEEAELAASGIAVERRAIADLEGDRGVVAAVRLADGSRVPIDGGFVRPDWTPALDFLDDLGVDLDPHGHLLVDRSGRTSIAGLYGAGDAVAPGPQQLIIAAGQGARVAAVLVHDQIGVRTAH
ncbi:NAD(P)/FAD-dependent oxidoreductase [Microbacterium deminutum]|uniref:NAD(P)/FAD-dependent oxidoreductase n=1 Tax=Microbacterium deminutum TaxID=344164 RepID=A0ABN2QPN1_9MICO